MPLSQEDGARLMAAANKWVQAERRSRQYSGATYKGATRIADLRDAKQAFAELVAKLTESEGL